MSYWIDGCLAARSYTVHTALAFPHTHFTVVSAELYVYVYVDLCMWILNDSFPKCGLVTFIRPKLGKKAISPLFILLQHHIYRTGGPPIGELVNMDEAAARCLSRCSIADFLEVFDILNLSWKSEKCHLTSPDMVTWTVLTMLTFPYQDWSDLPNR